LDKDLKFFENFLIEFYLLMGKNTLKNDFVNGGTSLCFTMSFNECVFGRKYKLKQGVLNPRGY
jgi:hypothetical protein